MSDDSRGKIDRFFDKFERAIDATIPTGRLGIVTVSEQTAEGKPTIVRHFGLYRMALVCDESRPFETSQYSETVPRGGYMLFCIRCIAKCVDELRDV